MDSICCSMHCYVTALYFQTASKEQPQFAGVVTSLGPKAQSAEAKSGLARPTSAADLQVGDRVLGACRFGSYATHLNVSAQQVTPPLIPPLDCANKTHNCYVHASKSYPKLFHSSHASHCNWVAASTSRASHISRLNPVCSCLPLHARSNSIAIDVMIVAPCTV